MAGEDMTVDRKEVRWRFSLVSVNSWEIIGGEPWQRKANLFDR